MPTPRPTTTRRTVLLVNDFHGTAHAIRPTPIVGDREGRCLISRAAVLRARRTLCGNAGCTCGGEFGERGGTPQRYNVRVINETYNRALIVRVEEASDPS